MCPMGVDRPTLTRQISLTRSRRNNMSELVRANRISVMVAEGLTIAKLWRTHKMVAEIAMTDAMGQGFVADPTVNATAQRELFRAWIGINAPKFGVKYDPTDNRTDANQFPSKYTDGQLVTEWAIKIVENDLREWATKMGKEFNQEITMIEASAEILVPTTITKSGKAVNSQYGNGNWAYCTIPVTATFDTNGVQGYVTMTVELVSGQMKKPGNIADLGFTYTGFKTELLKDLKSALPVIEKVSVSKSKPVVADETTPNPVEVEMMAVEIPAKPKKTRKSKKKTDSEGSAEILAIIAE